MVAQPLPPTLVPIRKKAVAATQDAVSTQHLLSGFLPLAEHYGEHTGSHCDQPEPVKIETDKPSHPFMPTV
jgi:hypothetical protein